MEPSGYLRTSAESTMQIRHPPSPAVEPKNDNRRAPVDGDDRAHLAGVARRAFEHQQIAIRIGRDAAHGRMVGRKPASRSRAPAPVPDRPARSAPSDRQASPCRCRASADQPGVRDAAGPVGVRTRRSAWSWPYSTVVSRDENRGLAIVLVAVRHVGCSFHGMQAEATPQAPNLRRNFVGGPIGVDSQAAFRLRFDRLRGMPMEGRMTGQPSSSIRSAATSPPPDSAR